MYGVYISQLVHYFRACAQYSDFLDKAQMITQNPLKLLVWSHPYNNSMFVSRTVDRYEISISQILVIMDIFFILHRFFFFPLPQKSLFPELDYMNTLPFLWDLCNSPHSFSVFCVCFIFVWAYFNFKLISEDVAMAWIEQTVLKRNMPTCRDFLY